MSNKITFALFFGNRGFFPCEVIHEARIQIIEAVENSGHKCIYMEEKETRYGAIETAAEGRQYADFLKANEGEYQGIIISLPNFGDENGALEALKNAKVPILIQAFPDEIGKMGFSHRRDAMCGKFAVCNVLRQAKIPFTLTKSFVTSPESPEFNSDLKTFAAVCRVVDGMKSFNLGAIGARTTAFKTVRVDEIALQNVGINLETIDLSEVFFRMKTVSQERIEKAKDEILQTTVFSGFPQEKLEKISCLQVVLEDIIEEYNLKAVAIRCWNEFETVLGIAPCTNLSLLNQKGISAACEVDVSNAVMMRALSLAAGGASTLLDFNNNYGDSADKAIMFHCGPVPVSMMKEKGRMIEHLMFKKSYGDGSGVGVNKGEILSGTITFGSVKTEDGGINAFVTNGQFTDDIIEPEFFGTGKVVEKNNINAVSNYMAENGYKHHLCVTFGDYTNVINEAFSKYLKYNNEVL